MLVAYPPVSEMSPAQAEKAAALVLVVDDDPLVSQLVEAALPAGEFAVQSARTGKQALEQWGRQRPAVLVLDNLLPDAKGLELLAQFRQRDATLPVIFIT